MIVAILGAGPAGMSCANACLSFGLTPVVIERADHLGGAQRANFHPNLWLLGSPDESGQALTQRLVAHYAELQAETLLATEVREVAPAEGANKTTTTATPPAGFQLTLQGPGGARVLRADAVVLATGARPYAPPELLKLAKACPRILVGPLNDSIRDGVRNADVLILGGGDNALDHALFLAERGNRARVCTRAAFSGRESLLAACRAHAAIALDAHCPTPAIVPGEHTVHADGRRYDWLLVMYGYRPNSDVLERFAEQIRPPLAASGHVEVDAWQRTPIPGIYAAGDVTDTVQPAIPTAIAQGLAAAKAIERDAKLRLKARPPAGIPAPTP